MRLAAGWIPLFLLAVFLSAAPAAHAEEPLGAVDHVILGIADLDDGVREFEKLTGVKPAFGGQHPGVGTHNALVALGDGSYLELIAPQPGVTPSERWSRLVGIGQLTPVGWAVRTSDLDMLRATLEQTGIETMVPRNGSRARPDGLMLKWRSADITAPQMAFAPFFIEWGKSSAHPSTTSPEGCRLDAVEIRDPEPAVLTRLVNALGLNAKVTERPESTIIITLECPRGRVVFGER
jgi:glyoxalase-like protein